MPSTFFSYLKSRQGWLSLFLVVACAVTLSWFLFRTFFVPLPRSYTPDFGAAQWISAAEPSHGYFRKTLYVDSRVSHAWLQIAATDTYELSVNGTSVDNRMFNATCVTGLYDLKPFLREGKNVIGIHVYRISFPGAAQILASGAYALANSPPQQFISDASWKVSNTPDGITGGSLWNSPDLDDASWASAGPGRSDGRPETILPLRFPPELLRTPPLAAWIGPSDTHALQATYRSEITIPQGRVETWIQVAAVGTYDVLINGKPAISQSTVLTDDKALRKDILSLTAYNISPALHTGSNTMLVRVRSETGPPALFVDGAVFRGNRVLPIFTSETWKTSVFSGGEPESSWQNHATVLAHYDDAPWRTLHDGLTSPEPISTSDYHVLFTWLSITLVTLSIVLFLWMAISKLLSLISGHPAARLWNADAILHFVLLIVLLSLLLVSFDIRLARDWCFRPEIALGAVAFLAGSKILLPLLRREAGSAEPDLETRAPTHRGDGYLIVALIGLMIAGGAVRYSHVSDISLDVDEMSVIEFSKGILEDGFPHIRMGSYTKRATTYEFLNYPLAAAQFLFGTSEAALRAPALVFSTITIGLLGWVGRRIFDWRVGLITAVIYAFHPTCIYWSRNAFWPAQAQLLVLFTVWFFYEAIQTRPFRSGYVTAAAIAFIFSYLTWEGSGFILPALAVALFLARWGEYDWLKNWHFWRCLFVMAVVVVLQLCHRQLAGIPTYVQVGTSLAEISTPQIVYLDPTTYDPSYYLDNFLFIENNYVLTLVTLAGIPFWWPDRRLRFLVAVSLVSFVSYSWFLPAYAVRYSYHYQTLLILIPVGILFKLGDLVAALATGGNSHSWPGWAASAGTGLAILMLVLGANESVLRLFRLSSTPTNAYYAMRTGLYRNDYRGPALFVKDHYQPGDALVVLIPHVFEHYSGLKSDYSINTQLNKKTFYDGGSAVPKLIDKFRGLPSIQSEDDLLDVRSRYPRVWLVLVPVGPTPSQNPEVETYMADNQKVLYESYRARVVLLTGAQPSVRQN